MTNKQINMITNIANVTHKNRKPMSIIAATKLFLPPLDG